MSVIAKFVCNWKQAGENGQGQQITMSPVYDGSEENKRFFASTPGGSIQLYTLNPEAYSYFENGKEYYVTFQIKQNTECDDESCHCRQV